MKNKAVLITGASSGIGKGYAYEYAKQGYDLVIVARSKDKLDYISEDIKKTYQNNVAVINVDLTSKDSP